MSDDEQQQQHQPWSPPDSEEEIGDVVPRTLKRSTASAGKRPLTNWGYTPGYDQDEAPDLGAYFDQWNLSEKKQILVCRGYASYLAAMQDAKKK